MGVERDRSDLEDALARCTAAGKAIAAARDRIANGEAVYPVHLHLAAVELAHAIELAMKVAMRNPQS